MRLRSPAGTWAATRWVNFFAELQRTIQIDQFDVDDVLADGQRVAVLGKQRATVRETGREFNNDWAHVYTFRNGKIAEAHLYGDTHAVASAFGDSVKEREALTGPMGVTHPAYSGRPNNDF